MAAHSKANDRIGSARLRAYGPVAVVTGASSGIGRAMASSLAEAGFDLVLVARRADEMEELASQLSGRHGTEATVVALDLAEAGAGAALLERTRDIDVGLLVAAAGYGTSGAFERLDVDMELGMIDVNCRAVTELAHGFARRFVARKRGGLVMMGSLVGWQGTPFSATYSATKAFVNALAEGLSVEFRPKGIDVLLVSPGPVHSGFAARARMTMGAADTPAAVARDALAALGRRSAVVPGRTGKLLTNALSLLPRRARVAIMGRIMASMARRDGETGKETKRQPA